METISKGVVSTDTETMDGRGPEVNGKAKVAPTNSLDSA